MLIISAILGINPIAILIALISHFFIGYIWYSPLFFGKIWKELRGTNKQPTKLLIFIGFISHVIYIFALAIIINLIKVISLMDGVLIGIVISIGFIGTTLINELIYGKLCFELFLIKLGDEIISLCIAVIIIVSWIK